MKNQVFANIGYAALMLRRFWLFFKLAIFISYPEELTLSKTNKLVEKMQFKAHIFIAIITVCNLAIIDVKAQDDGFELVRGGLRIAPKAGLENFSNITNSDNIWVLLPSAANLTEPQLSSGDFFLFKLNTSPLASKDHGSNIEYADEDLSAEEQGRQHYQENRGRKSRKINFFKNVLNKPKVSPLYLVNGTVCRFVNSQPICTTLSTTGLLRKYKRLADG